MTYQIFANKRQPQILYKWYYGIFILQKTPLRLFVIAEFFQ